MQRWQYPAFSGPSVSSLLFLICIALETEFSPAAAQVTLFENEGITAILDSHIATIEDDNLTYFDCSLKDEKFKILEKLEDENKLNIRYKIEEGKDSVSFVKSKKMYKGVEIIEYAAMSPFPGASPKERIIFRMPVNDAYRLNFYSWSYCAWLGYEPQELSILYSPNQKGAVSTWASSLVRLGQIEPVEPGKPIIFDDKVENGAIVYMVPGREIEVFESLSASEWVIDFSMTPNPMGLSFRTFEFPEKVIAPRALNIAYAENFTRSVLLQAFPRLDASRVSITSVSGTRFEVIINAPALSLGLSQIFSQHWLKVVMTVGYFNQGSSVDELSTRMVVLIKDGYLPKWPPNSSVPPDPEHLAQFHLNDESDRGKKYDFTALHEIDERINHVLVRDYSAYELDM